MNREQLAQDIFLALYSNPKVEPEDYKHNAIVAARAADALIEALNVVRHVDGGSPGAGAAAERRPQGDTPPRRSKGIQEAV